MQRSIVRSSVEAVFFLTFGSLILQAFFAKTGNIVPFLVEVENKALFREFSTVPNFRLARTGRVEQS